MLGTLRRSKLNLSIGQTTVAGKLSAKFVPTDRTTKHRWVTNNIDLLLQLQFETFLPQTERQYDQSSLSV